MQVLIVTDSLKESLKAHEVAKAIAKGIGDVDKGIKTQCVPFSDGGEGALTVLNKHSAGTIVDCPTVDALGRPMTASYFLFKNEKKAWIELSQASGLAQIAPELRNPLITSTYGTGLQIKDAIEKGCTDIILGIGGSATNDAGTGIFEALGGQLLDKNKHPIARGGAALKEVESVVLPQNLGAVRFKVACDVDNPLLGVQGASAVYGPQKGASPEDVVTLEKALTHFATTIKRQTGREIAALKGGGAAGGTAAGMAGLFEAQLAPGFSLLSEMIALEKAIEEADLIFTAEGKIDRQSLNGKVPVGVAQLAKKHQKPCIGLAGAVEGPYTPLYQAGFSGVFSLQNGPMSMETSKENAFELLADTAARVFYFFQKSKP